MIRRKNFIHSGKALISKFSNFQRGFWLLLLFVGGGWFVLVYFFSPGVVSSLLSNKGNIIYKE